MASINNIDLSGLNRFKRTLKEMSANNLDQMKKTKIKEISDFAFNVLNKNYGGTPFEVEPPKYDETKSTIYAKGEGIAFDEFGTGFYADGTYKGKKPTQTLVFESAGYPQTTSEWDYYYTWKGPANRNPKRTTKDGRKGWFTTKDTPKFQIGEPASNRFYDSVVEIKEKFKENNK